MRSGRTGGLWMTMLGTSASPAISGWTHALRSKNIPHRIRSAFQGSLIDQSPRLLTGDYTQVIALRCRQCMNPPEKKSPRAVSAEDVANIRMRFAIRYDRLS